NVLTLLAIVLATGLVVDDGIVVTENIYKKIEEGMNPIEAAIKGSQEMFFPIISISVTLAAVWLPVIFLEGFVGRLLRAFGVCLGSGVLVSAFASRTPSPMCYAYLATPGKQGKSKFYQVTEQDFVAMNDSYNTTLEWFMQRIWRSFPILIACFGLIVLFYSL